MDRRQGMILAALTLLLVALLGYWLYRSSQHLAPEPVPAPPVVVAPKPAPAPEPEPPVVPEAVPEPVAPESSLMPAADSLDTSGSVLLALAQELSPALVQWLVDEELLRKWVILVDQIADGDLSHKHLPIDYPMAKFAIRGTLDQALAEPRNYARATPLIEALVAVEPDTVAAYYRLWQPLLDQAYGELGKPGRFHDRLLLAIDRLLKAPLLPEGAALAARPVVFKYQDPKLERASPLHKWLWRLGPDNRARINAYLVRLQRALAQG